MNQLSVSTLTLHYGAETQSCILIKYQHDWLVINSTASNHVRQLKGASLKQTTAMFVDTEQPLDEQPFSYHREP